MALYPATPEPLDLDQLTPLVGHTSQDTAYLQTDYPYGRKLRCQRKVWVEYHPNHGMRFCTQTSNPKQYGTWNKPKKSTYSHYVCLLHNPENDHVIDYNIEALSDHESIQQFRQFWSAYYSRLDEFNRERLDQLGKLIAKAATNRKHVHPTGVEPHQQTPRIEVDIDWLYSPEQGLHSEVYAHLVKEDSEADPDLSQVPVVSAQATTSKGKTQILYNLLAPDQFTDEVNDLARAIVTWKPSDYGHDHWCRAVLNGYRGFEFEGEPINNTVQTLLKFKHSTRQKTEADRRAYQEIKQGVWNEASEYWHQQKQKQEQGQNPVEIAVGVGSGL